MRDFSLNGFGLMQGRQTYFPDPARSPGFVLISLFLSSNGSSPFRFFDAV
jgi:hypothetical protein